MIPRGFRRLFTLDTGRPDLDDEVDQELRFHIDTSVTELIEQGWSPESARAEAERRFGNLRRTRDRLIDIDSGREVRVRRTERWEAVGQDLKLAVRSLLREPGLVATVVITLALGIGANATMVGLVDRLLFRPPAHVNDAGQVRQLSLTQVHPTFGQFTNTGVAWPDFLLTSRASGFASTAAFYTARLTLGRGVEAEPVRVTMATAGFFPLLGVQPVAGRFYTAEDDRVGTGSPVVVISEQFWQRRFGSDPAVLGTSIRLGSTLFTVIGIAPRGFSGIELNRVDAWVPVGSGAREVLGPNQEWSGTRNWEWVRVLGRLEPGARQEAVEAELTTTYRGEIAGDPDRNQNAYLRLHSIIAGRGPEAPQSTRVALWLAGVSFVVLLITCANVANLLLARGTRRQREVAVRLALGIRRRRLVAGLLLESLFLAVLGGGLALLAAQWGGEAIRNFLMPDIDWVGPPVDARVVVMASLATLITLVAVGLLPAIQTSRPDLTVALKAGSQAAGRDPRHARLRRALLVTQTALSVLLLSGAGLFVRSLQNVARIDLGFEPHGLLVAAADVSGSNLSREERVRLARRLLEAVKDFPGVASASLGIAVPFQTRYSTELRLPGHDSLPTLPTGYPSYNGVSPGFFETTGMRLVQGRDFGEGDSDAGAPVMIVNESMARTFWPGENPVGRCVMVGGDSVPPCFQVIGVVADARRAELREDPTMQYFVAEQQAAKVGMSSDRSLYLRVTGDQDAMVEPIRRAIIEAAPEVAWARVTPMDSFLEPHVQPWRLGASMFGIFGLLALLVAAVGLYGVMAYSVATRTREFGVRGALGASSGALAGQVLREGLRLTSLGLVLGAAAALGIAGLIASLLFETPARDPVVLGTVSGLLLSVAMLASLIPAWRAARTAPADALRGE